MRLSKFGAWAALGSVLAWPAASAQPQPSGAGRAKAAQAPASPAPSRPVGYAPTRAQQDEANALPYGRVVDRVPDEDYDVLTHCLAVSQRNVRRDDGRAGRAGTLVNACSFPVALTYAGGRWVSGGNCPPKMRPYTVSLRPGQEERWTLDPAEEGCAVVTRIGVALDPASARTAGTGRVVDWWLVEDRPHPAFGRLLTFADLGDGSVLRGPGRVTVNMSTYLQRPLDNGANHLLSRIRLDCSARTAEALSTRSSVAGERVIGQAGGDGTTAPAGPESAVGRVLDRLCFNRTSGFVERLPESVHPASYASRRFNGR